MIQACDQVNLRNATVEEMANYFWNNFHTGEIADFFNWLGEHVFHDMGIDPKIDAHSWGMYIAKDLTPRGRDLIVALANWVTYHEKCFPSGKYSDMDWERFRESF